MIRTSALLALALALAATPAFAQNNCTLPSGQCQAATFIAAQQEISPVVKTHSIVNLPDAGGWWFRATDGGTLVKVDSVFGLGPGYGVVTGLAFSAQTDPGPALFPPDGGPAGGTLLSTNALSWKDNGPFNLTAAYASKVWSFSSDGVLSLPTGSYLGGTTTPPRVDAPAANAAGDNSSVFIVGGLPDSGGGEYMLQRVNGLGQTIAWEFVAADPSIDTTGGPEICTNRFTGSNFIQNDCQPGGPIPGFEFLSYQQACYPFPDGGCLPDSNPFFRLEWHDRQTDGGAFFRYREGVGGGPGGTKTPIRGVVVNGQGCWEWSDGSLTCDSASTGLKSATTTVAVSSATAPSSGQVLTATSSTAATWQTPSAGSAAQIVLGTVWTVTTPLATTNTNTTTVNPTGLQERYIDRSIIVAGSGGGTWTECLYDLTAAACTNGAVNTWNCNDVAGTMTNSGVGNVINSGHRYTIQINMSGCVVTAPVVALTHTIY